MKQPLSPSVLCSEARRAGWGILVDDLSPHERVILVAPARELTAELMNRLIGISNGLTFVTLSPERAQAFLLEPMGRQQNPADPQRADGLMLLTSVEAREGVSTGISAADRAATIRILAADPCNPRALVKPGHVFPVRISPGGILADTALPTSAAELGTLWWNTETVLFMDLLSPDGRFAERSVAHSLSELEQVPLTTLSALLTLRLSHERLVQRVGEAALPTEWGGDLRAIAYRSTISPAEHLALLCGTIEGDTPILTRVQVESLCSDVFGGAQSPSRRRIRGCLALMRECGRGVFLYLRSPDGNAMIPATATEQMPMVQTMRHHGVGAQILRDLGIGRVELLTSGQKALPGLSLFGVEITSQRILDL